MAYATPTELAQWMGLPSVDQARAQLKLDVATGLVEDEIGQSLVLGSTTDNLDGTGSNSLVLSRWPVTAVTSVTVDGVALVAGEDYKWERAGILTRIGGVWGCDEKITVVYTAGYDPIPPSVKGLVLELAAGSWSATGGKKSERIGDYQVAWAREGMSLSTADKKALGRYRANR